MLADSTLISSRKSLCPWRMAGMIALLNLIALGLALMVLHQSQQLYQDRAAVVSQNLSHLLEQDIAETINKAELAVMVAVDEITERRSPGAIADALAMDAWLARLDERLPELASIRAFDAVGKILYGKGAHAGSVNISDRDFFRYLRDHPDAGTVLSSPFLGRVSNKWVFVVSRRMNHPDGTFAGIVNGAIELDYYAKLFFALDIGPKGFVALRDADLGILVRHPKLSSGSDVGDKTVSPQWRELLKINPKSGTFTSSSPLDNVNRMNSYRMIGGRPLYVIVGLAEEDYLADWRKDVMTTMIGVVIFSILSILASLIVCRIWRRRRMSLEILEQNQEMFRALTEMSTDWFWEQGKDFRFTELSGELVRRFGASPENFVGKTRWDIAVDVSEEKIAMHKATVMAHQPFKDFEYSFCNQTGEKRTISVSGVPLFDIDGQFIGYRGIGKDLTDKRSFEDRIRHMAQFDSLTNLPNRALFNDRLFQLISMARREGNEFALLYLDLDKFKPVNDRYGHSAGDDLLRQVAERITVLLRESDTVARLGGDEFAALLPRVTCRADAQEVSQKIIDILTQPFNLEDISDPVVIGVSVGIAIFPQDAENVNGMIKASDAAMYESKKKGNSYQFYSDMQKQD